MVIHFLLLNLNKVYICLKTNRLTAWLMKLMNSNKRIIKCWVRIGFEIIIL